MIVSKDKNKLKKEGKKTMEKAKIRKGTFCKICGNEILPTDGIVKAEGGCLGGVIYAHRECACYGDSIASYSHEELKEHHKETYSGFRFGCEFETNTHTTPEQRLQLYAWYGLRCTHDCTVTNEFKSGIVNGLHGLKTMLNGISSIIDIASGDNVGTHINASLTTWNNNTLCKIRANATEIFKPLLEIMKSDRQNCINVFGRYFGDYRAYDTIQFMHGDAICIKSNCIEYRISKYQSTQQYFFLVAMIKEFTLIIDKFIQGKINAIQASRQIVKAYQRRINGTAKYMSAERNKNG